ncbi:sigma-70 family RNA polymerase sigma factor [Oerskovia flava]|uniref:sigma-70 family RNA polymerase sigma factor n=1 Tax=Oerskovia flava TaxID=2986422 RepID=UPI00223F33D0|nr:sigma-70 family RNA polymerase sigma factor [Oerskovia sp. JB1-3-2]
MAPENPIDVATRSDEELVASVRDGDADAYATLWERHAGAGRAAARRITGSFDPEDLVQEAYVRILAAIRSGHGPTGPFRPYLYQSIRSIAASWARSPQLFPVEDVPEVGDPRDIAETVLDGSMTTRAFRRLPQRWQAVLWYTEVEGMEPRDVAPLLGLQAGAVSALAYRAREGLRREWLQVHVNEEAVAPECRWAVARMAEHQRGALSAVARDRFDEHLTGCLSCAILVEEIDEVASRLALVLVPLVLGLPAVLGGGSAAVGVLASGAPVGTGAPMVAGGPVVTDTSTSGVGPTGGGSASAASAATGHGALLAGLIAVGAATVAGVLAFAQPWAGETPVPATESVAAPATPSVTLPEPDHDVRETTDDTADDTVAEPGGEVAADDTGVAGSEHREDGADAPTEELAEEDTGTGPAAETPAAPESSEGSTGLVPPTVPVRPPDPVDPTDPEVPVVLDAPTVVGPAAGELVHLPELGGEGTPGALVELLDARDQVVGTATVDEAGAWTAVPWGLDGSGEQTIVARQSQRTGGVDVVSEPSGAVGPYTFERPRLTAPADGASVPYSVLDLDGNGELDDLQVVLTGQAGRVLEVVVDGVPTGNRHTVGLLPLVRTLSGLAPGEHTVGVRYVADDRVGPLRVSAFTIVP